MLGSGRVRAHWRRFGYVAAIKYEDGCPRLVGVPVKA